MRDPVRAARECMGRPLSRRKAVYRLQPAAPIMLIYQSHAAPGLPMTICHEFIRIGHVSRDIAHARKLYFVLASAVDSDGPPNSSSKIICLRKLAAEGDWTALLSRRFRGWQTSCRQSNTRQILLLPQEKTFPFCPHVPVLALRVHWTLIVASS